MTYFIEQFARIECIFSATLNRLGLLLMLAIALAGQSVIAQTVTTTLNAGVTPLTVAINPLTNKTLRRIA